MVGLIRGTYVQGYARFILYTYIPPYFLFNYVLIKFKSNNRCKSEFACVFLHLYIIILSYIQLLKEQTNKHDAAKDYILPSNALIYGFTRIFCNRLQAFYYTYVYLRSLRHVMPIYLHIPTAHDKP